MEKYYDAVFLTFCRTAISDDQSLNILIYQQQSFDGWILEVIDKDDNSFVWENFFATDQDALDKVMSILEEEGFLLFLNPLNDRVNYPKYVVVCCFQQMSNRLFKHTYTLNHLTQTETLPSLAILHF
jgi:hypothetical protein